MILTIDTQKDSAKDIQKAIEFLRQFAEQQTSQPTESIPSTQATQNFSALFDMPLASSPQTEHQQPQIEQRTIQPNKKFFFQTY
jgi:hypothetical protein